MLPIDAVRLNPALNFLNQPETLAVVEARLTARNWGGIVQPDRLYRNLLSSQPLCFNIFGFLDAHRDQLHNAVSHLVGQGVEEVSSVRLEWAPPPNLHLGSGSAFDCFIEYKTRQGAIGFLGVETKYSEDLRDQRVSSNPAHSAATVAGGLFREGAPQRLRTPLTSQLWYNVLLAQSLAQREGYAQGRIVVLACKNDLQAAEAVRLVRDELLSPNDWLSAMAYEELLEGFGGGAISSWKSEFQTRYLDFSRSDTLEA